MAADDSAGQALPQRTTRRRRAGRHSSPHQLSVPPEAPAIIIAVPGAPQSASDEIADEVASGAAASCPGVSIRVGYTGGGEKSLSSVLASFPSQGGLPSAVVVPLVAGPHPVVDAAVADQVAAAGGSALVAGHLGPHPLLAEAMHHRLAEAGLAKAGRAGRINVAAAAEGVVVAAAGQDEAVQVAGVVAVLLAARLAVPVATGSLDDEGSVRDAVGRLRDAGVDNLAIAPCVIGPEAGERDIADVAAGVGVSSASALGSHPAIGQLVAIRYGAALEDPQLAGAMS